MMKNFLSAGDDELQSQVTISVGILRATGLKDAALSACKDSPVSMAFAAEVGVNAYVKLKLPLLSAKVSLHHIMLQCSMRCVKHYRHSMPGMLSVSILMDRAVMVAKKLVQCLG